jgi:hypothetical protein
MFGRSVQAKIDAGMVLDSDTYRRKNETRNRITIA